MTPALGVSCSRISLAVVVLPQPDSPMTPRVSPDSMVKSTPSTALTHATRRGNRPLTLGKYFASPSACSSGAMQRPVVFLDPWRGAPAARGPAGGAPHVVGLRADAARQGFAAARMKGAARRQRCEVGRLTRDREQRLLAAELRP